MSRRWLWILLLGVLALLLFWQRGGPIVADGSWLVVELSGEYVEAQASPLTARLLGRTEQPLAGVLSELSKAERDDRIAGVALRIGSLDGGWGKARELRRAIERLRERGKRTLAYLELEKYGANREFYIASAADRVIAAPASRNPFVGFASEYFFLSGFFEKLGVDVVYERIGKYKTAAEQFGEAAMSEPNREMSEALLDSIADRFVADIAESRELSVERVSEVIDLAPSSPAAWLETGLIDGVGWLDEALADEGDPPTLDSDAYAAVPAESVGWAPVASFALVYGAGPVVVGEGGRGLGGGPVFAAGAVSDAIDAAVKSPDIRAILFRIDSPGGSPLASDLVWHAVRRARAAGKPVVASMSDVAASGGYYAAVGADRIVAEPGTLTGSIGVFVLRPILEGMLEKLGVGYAALTRGEHADLLLSARPLSPGSRARMREEVESVYRLFLERVSEGRGMTVDEVDQVAQGRVWTGAQALEVGLVDVLGGLREAAREAKGLTGLDPDDDVYLVPYPTPKPLIQQLSEAMDVSLRAEVRAALPSLPDGVHRVAQLLRALPTGTPVLVPPVLPEVH
jgi:protease-4